MLRSLLVGILSSLAAAILPVVLLSPMEQAAPDDRLLIIETTKIEESSPKTVQLQTAGEIIKLPLEEYLTGVLICEMPLSFEEEALKAQTVAARTFALEQMEGGKHEGFDLCDDSSCCQAWCSSQQLKEKLGDSFEACWEKAQQAVNATAQQALYYENRLIDAVYFSCSGGATEAAVAVWGSEVPYLQSVESPGEEQTPKFTSVVRFLPEELASRLGRDDLTGDPVGWIGESTRSEGGGIASLVIGGEAYTGTELRAKLGLASTLFSVAVEGEFVEFTVHGYGHRVGMSQYGANAMAEEGSDYREILAHYYPGTEIKLVS